MAQVVQQTTQAVAAMGAGSTAEAAGQTQPSATAHADTTGQSPAASAGTPIDASTKPQTEPSTAPQRQEATLGGSPDSTAASQTNRSTPIQESPLQQAQQQPAAAEGVAKPEQTRTDAARPATADAVPPQGERSSAAVARADSQSGSSSGRPQTEGHGQEHGGTATPDRTPQIDNRIASAQARFAEPELTPGEVKVRAKSEGGDTASDQKPQTDQSGSSASGKGFITRIWTGPDRAEVSSAASQDPNGNHRNQALAAEATRQIARFIAEPRTRGDATSTRSEMVSTSQNSVPSSGGTSTQTITTPVSDGMSQTPSPTPAVGAPAADGRAEQAVSLTRTDTPRQADGTAMQDSIDRLARVLRAHIGDRESQVRIQLDPPELGRVRIDIRMRSDVLVLQVETETAAGRNLLSSRLNELRDALQQHGIHVERASVQIRDAVSETPQTREQQQHQQPSQHGNQQHGQEAPGQAGDQPGRSGRHDGPAQGEEVPASTSDSREDASAESETSAADAGQASGGDRSASMAESWLDLVA
ncbi:MAG: flagellar hook-length control protein FliK [Phycisphaerae bacterium]|nr:flagellar hook-length control protein FliK [Phycisphaerae bacterium]